MRGWILYRDAVDSLQPEVYELRRLLQVAAELDIDMRVVSPEQIDLVVTRGDRKSVLLDGEEVALPNFLLPRMGAATTYFALAVVRHLERLGVNTFNSSQSIETVRDKLFTHQILAQSNLPVAKTMLAKFPVDTASVTKRFDFPVVVKTVSGTQGTGVFLCENREYFEDLMHLIQATKSNVNIIIQEFIESSRGRDLRVFLVGGRAVACMRRTAAPGSFKANFHRGGTVEMAELTPEIEWLAAEAARLLGLDISGIDLLYDGDHFRICEANSSPGFEGIESCHQQISIPHQIYSFVAVRMGQFDQIPRLASLPSHPRNPPSIDENLGEGIGDAEPSIFH